MVDMAIHSSRMLKSVTCVALVVVSTSILAAHGILLTSTPKANEIVTGPKMILSLKFNSRVDQGRSTRVLAKSDHSIFLVPITVNEFSPARLTGMSSSLPRHVSATLAGFGRGRAYHSRGRPFPGDINSRAVIS